MIDEGERRRELGMIINGHDELRKQLYQDHVTVQWALVMKEELLCAAAAVIGQVLLHQVHIGPGTCKKEVLGLIINTIIQHITKGHQIFELLNQHP